MHDAFRHRNPLVGHQLERRTPFDIDAQVPAENIKKFVFVIVLVPMKLALDEPQPNHRIIDAAKRLIEPRVRYLPAEPLDVDQLQKPELHIGMNGVRFCLHHAHMPFPSRSNTGIDILPSHELDLVAILKALANARRVLILQWLKSPRAHFREQIDGDLEADGVCALLIAEKLEITQPTLSEHMKILVQAGLVRAKRIKQWTFYQRDEERIAQAKELFSSL